MNRRRRSSVYICLTILMTLAMGTASMAQETSDPQQKVLVLRHIVIKSAEKQRRVLRILEGALLPALNQAGVSPIGVFTAAPDQPQGQTADHSVYLLAQFDSLNDWDASRRKIMSDGAIQQAMTEYLESPPDDPVYERSHVTIMKGFEGFPEIVKPEDGPRIFELRTYESYNDIKAQLKVAMFNEGELDVFKKVGLRGVFFGQTIAGPNLPNLTYMLVYKDREEERQVWDAFRNDPDWHALRENPRYADTVSQIHRVFLLPADFSQL